MILMLHTVFVLGKIFSVASIKLIFLYISLYLNLFIAVVPLVCLIIYLLSEMSFTQYVC